jgi:hypothetical protein
MSIIRESGDHKVQIVTRNNHNDRTVAVVKSAETRISISIDTYLGRLGNYRLDISAENFVKPHLVLSVSAETHMRLRPCV